MELLAENLLQYGFILYLMIFSLFNSLLIPPLRMENEDISCKT